MIIKPPVLKLAVVAFTCVSAPFGLQAKNAVNDDVVVEMRGEDPTADIIIDQDALQEEIITRGDDELNKRINMQGGRPAGKKDPAKQQDSPLSSRLYALGGIDVKVEFERIEQGKLYFEFAGVKQSMPMEQVLGLRFRPYSQDQSAFAKIVLGLSSGELLHIDKYAVAGDVLKFSRAGSEYEIPLAQVVQLRPYYLEGELLYKGPDEKTLEEGPMPPGKQGGWVFKDGACESRGNGVLLAPMGEGRNFILRFTVRNLQHGGSNGLYVVFGCKKPKLDLSERKKLDADTKLAERFEANGNMEYFSFDRLPPAFGACAAVQFDHNLARGMAINFDADGIPLFDDLSNARYDYGAQVQRASGKSNTYEVRFNQKNGLFEAYINGYRSMALNGESVKKLELSGNMAAFFKTNEPNAELRVEDIMLLSWDPVDVQQVKKRKNAVGVVYCKDGKELHGEVSVSAAGVKFKDARGEQQLGFDQLKGFEICQHRPEANLNMLLLQSGERLGVQQLSPQNDSLKLQSAWGHSSIDPSGIIALTRDAQAGEFLLKTPSVKKIDNEKSFQ